LPFQHPALTAMSSRSSRHLVTDLYKRFLFVGKDYPRGLSFVRQQAKAAFQRNAGLTEEEDILRAVAKGRWWVKELIGVVQLKKYRALRACYGDAGAGLSGSGALEKRFEEEQGRTSSSSSR
jgi:hypothetical protein